MPSIKNIKYIRVKNRKRDRKKKNQKKERDLVWVSK